MPRRSRGSKASLIPCPCRQNLLEPTSERRIRRIILPERRNSHHIEPARRLHRLSDRAASEPDSLKLTYPPGPCGSNRDRKKDCGNNGELLANAFGHHRGKSGSECDEKEKREL